MSKQRIWILTGLPELYREFLDCGVVGKHLQSDQATVELKLVNLREVHPKGFKGLDDASYGGGPGMVMRADRLKEALQNFVLTPGGYSENWQEECELIYFTPRGKTWNRARAGDYAQKTKDLVIFCGRYEGIDERFIQKYINTQISLGDFVLSGADLAVMCVLDSFLRLRPGVLGNQNSLDSESFEQGLLDHPHYTRPAEFEGMKVPEVLLSGHDKKIAEYRSNQREEQTKLYRPDLKENK